MCVCVSLCNLSSFDVISLPFHLHGHSAFSREVYLMTLISMYIPGQAQGGDACTRHSTPNCNYICCKVCLLKITQSVYVYLLSGRLRGLPVLLDQ